MQQFLQIHPADNTAVALTLLPAGTILSVNGSQITLLQEIPRGHKFALKDFSANEHVIKYGAPIGYTTRPVSRGSWLHTHNLRTGLDSTSSYTHHYNGKILSPTEDRLFQGFRRSNGKVGIRNEIWILPTVGCVNDIARAVEKKAQNMICGSIDAICAFTHPYGCSQMGEDQENTRKILADLAMHPNAGGVLLLGLGCENSGIMEIRKYMKNYDQKRIRFLECQNSDNEIEDALRLLKELAEDTCQLRREPVSCRELVVGLKCGGSDGLSGITANPTVGVFSDLLLSKGGTTILTEVPEMFGAETLLMNRCPTRELFEKTVRMVQTFKEYYLRHGQPVSENPSPGNKSGGISTLEEKALGCTQKSGSAPISGVLEYGETATAHGLNLLTSPGNDLVASTALAAAGAQLILFTTGRGTPFAAPVPTVKLSSNSVLFQKKKHWIDFDCGTIIDDNTPEDLGAQLFELVLETASGHPVKSEQAGFHDFAIFRQGVTL